MGRASCLEWCSLSPPQSQSNSPHSAFSLPPSAASRRCRALPHHALPNLPTARPQLPPAAAVRSFMDAMDLSSPGIALLKKRLDMLARLSGDRGAKRTAIKWMYINPQVWD